MPHDPTKAQDPYRMALLEITAARNGLRPDSPAEHIELAKVHATLAVADAIRAQLAAYVEDRDQARGWLADAAEHAADKCPKCYYPTTPGQPDGEPFCENCGWEA